MDRNELCGLLDLGLSRVEFERIKYQVLDSGEPVHVYIARLISQRRVELRGKELVWVSAHLPIPMLTYEQILHLKNGDILVLMPGVVGCNKTVDNPRLATFEKIDEDGSVSCYGHVRFNPVFAAGYVAHIGNINDPEHKFDDELGIS